MRTDGWKVGMDDGRRYKRGAADNERADEVAQTYKIFIRASFQHVNFLFAKVRMHSRWQVYAVHIG